MMIADRKPIEPPLREVEASLRAEAAIDEIVAARRDWERGWVTVSRTGWPLSSSRYFLRNNSNCG